MLSVIEHVIELPIYFIIVSKHQTRVSLKNRRRKEGETKYRVNIATCLALRNLSEPIITRKKLYNLGTFPIKRKFII